MVRTKAQLTEAEWAIIQIVWESQPCTAPEVQEILQKQKGWAYSTVKTLMDRMAKKGLLKIERIRKLMLYRSAVTKKQAQNSEIMKTVKRAFNGAFTPMMQFMLDSNKMSPEQLDQVEQMIKKKRSKK